MVYAITVESSYAEAIAEKRKLVELRTRIPRGLKVGDYIVVCVKGTGGRVACWFEVGDVLCLSPATMWYSHNTELCVGWDDYWHYVGKRDYVYGIVVGRVYVMRWSIFVRRFGLARPPQWFSVVPKFPSVCLSNFFLVNGRKEIRNAATL